MTTTDPGARTSTVGERLPVNRVVMNLPHGGSDERQNA
jgi:hypothetical protein